MTARVNETSNGPALLTNIFYDYNNSVWFVGGGFDH